MSTLAGKTVLIAGASGGIGSAIAQRFAQQKARLVLVGRDDKKLGALVAQVRQPGQDKDHHRSVVIKDVANPAIWHSLVKEFDDVDVLVNSTGTTQHRLLIQTTEGDITRILSVNLTGTILACKSFGRRMVGRNYQNKKDPDFGCCIINVSSLLAEKGVVGSSVYAAAKAGIVGLTKSLAVEFASSRIRVNAVLPGYIDTPMTKDLGNKESLIESIPLRRFGTPDEVADAVDFLARNRYATGTILNLDGGLGSI